MNDSLETRRFKWILFCFEFLYLFDRHIHHDLGAYSHGIRTYAYRQEVYKAFVPNHKSAAALPLGKSHLAEP